MSIRLQIIFPLVLAIMAGIGVSFLIGRQATEGQRDVAMVVEQALDAREKSAGVALVLERMHEDLSQILTMTSFVSRNEVAQRFAAFDGRMTELLSVLRENTLSRDIQSQVEGMVSSYEVWRASLQVALGLAASNEIPTGEKLRREQQHLLDEVSAIEKTVSETARSKISQANLELEGKINSELTMLAAGGGVALLICLLIAQGITRPVLHVTKAMNELARGTTDVVLPRRSMTREINNMAAALEVFRDNALERLRLENESEAAQAERRRYTDEMARLLSGMSEMMNGAARGEFSRRVEVDFSVEDLRVLAQNANHLVDTVDRNFNSVLEVMTGLAEGDLDRRMTGDASGAFAELQISVNSTFEKLTPLILSIRQAADTVSRVSDEIKGNASDLSQRTEHQAASLEETAATIEEITQTVKQSEARALEAMERVNEARSSTERSGGIVRDAVSAMGRIEQASGEIGKITDLIDEIAFQTNLLALNAGVEAARAGDAGRGFAVVAQEVRALAQRSADAAKNIKQLIAKTRSEVSSGVSLVNAAGASLETIETQVAEIDQHIRSISVAAREQSEGVLGINGAVGRIDRLTQENVGMVQNTVGAVADMSREAGRLLAMVEHFKAEQANLRTYDAPSVSRAA